MTCNLPMRYLQRLVSGCEPREIRSSGSTVIRPKVILRDISRGEGYIIEAQGCVSGYFCLQHGLEPTYAQIRGEWPSEGPYLTIHRAAARIAGLHIFPAIISFASRYGLTLRADTHAQNKTMQRLLLRHGFRYCGEITLSDGSPRLAYQLDE